MAFRIFIACILLADDYGNLRFEPGWLKGQIYWAADVGNEVFLAAIEELTAIRDGNSQLVAPYVVKGQRYGAIRNWRRHQKVDRPGKPRVPPDPTDADTVAWIRECVAKHPRGSRGSPAPDHGRRSCSGGPDTGPDPDSGGANDPAQQPAATDGSGETRVEPPSLPPDGALVPTASPTVSQANGASSGPPGAIPDWWAQSVAAAEMAVGDIDQPSARWLEYDASRERKGWSRNHRDAIAWLVSVVRSERSRRPPPGPAQTGGPSARSRKLLKGASS